MLLPSESLPQLPEACYYLLPHNNLCIHITALNTLCCDFLIIGLFYHCSIVLSVMMEVFYYICTV